jgi:hypothetical protein
MNGEGPGGCWKYSGSNFWGPEHTHLTTSDGCLESGAWLSACGSKNTKHFRLKEVKSVKIGERQCRAKSSGGRYMTAGRGNYPYYETKMDSRNLIAVVAVVSLSRLHGRILINEQYH